MVVSTVNEIVQVKFPTTTLGVQKALRAISTLQIILIKLTLKAVVSKPGILSIKILILTQQKSFAYAYHNPV